MEQRIKLVEADITTLDVDALVNAANESPLCRFGPESLRRHAEALRAEDLPTEA